MTARRSDKSGVRNRWTAVIEENDLAVGANGQKQDAVGIAAGQRRASAA
jgi:hypothetical protein